MQSIFLKQTWRRRIAVLSLVSILVMAVPAPAARAGVWGESIASGFMQTAINAILKFIEDTLKGLAKRLAVELAVRQANKLTGHGHKNSPTFITDYKNYLYAVVLDEAVLATNDFLTQTLGAKYSGLVYTAASGNLQSLGRNYMTYLAAEAQLGLSDSYCKYNLDQYTVDPIRSLQQGDWRTFNALIANQCNNPAGYAQQTRRFFQADLERRRKANETRALAGGGFLGAEKNGKITAPGVLIRDVTSEAQTMALKLIPAANGWGEILSAAAGAFVNTMMTNLVQDGFESVSKRVSRELGKVDSKVLEARRDLEQQLGPGAAFLLRNTGQQVGANSNNQRSTEGKVNFNSTPGVCGTGAGAC